MDNQQDKKILKEIGLINIKLGENGLDNPNLISY